MRDLTTHRRISIMIKAEARISNTESTALSGESVAKPSPMELQRLLEQKIVGTLTSIEDDVPGWKVDVKMPQITLFESSGGT